MTKEELKDELKEINFLLNTLRKEEKAMQQELERTGYNESLFEKKTEISRQIFIINDAFNDIVNKIIKI